MILVIQCAANKNSSATCMRSGNGRDVMFVAHPEIAPHSEAHDFARPDDFTDGGVTWRTQLLRYNQTGENPLGFLPAWQLYTNPTYRQLAEEWGTNNLYILSAGWGLIPADFLTPKYDITFSTQADAFKRRHPGDHYDDFRMLPIESEEPAVFIGGKSYVNLFCQLSERFKGPRQIIYNSDKPPRAPGCGVKRFETTLRTNWHYQCAKAVLTGDFEIGVRGEAR